MTGEAISISVMVDGNGLMVKNSSEYNAWYYRTHPDKWIKDKIDEAVVNGAKWVFNKAKGVWEKAGEEEESEYVTINGANIPREWLDEPVNKNPNKPKIKMDTSYNPDDWVTDPESGIDRPKTAAEKRAEAAEREREEQRKAERKQKRKETAINVGKGLVKWILHSDLSDDIPQNDFRRYTELRHHGIMGMHWGIQNGPPYPLEDGDHSASEKRAGWRQSLDSGSGLSKGEMLLVKGTVMDRQQHPAIRGGQIAQGKAPIYKKLNEAGSRLKSKAGAAQKANENWYNRPDGLTQEAQEQRRLALVDAEKKYSRALTKEVDNMLGDGNWGPQDRLAVRRAISSAANYQGMMEAYDIKRGDERQADMGYWACNMNYIMTQAEPSRKRR